MKLVNYSIVFALALVSSAAAHPGPRIWIGNVGGKVSTFVSDNDLAPSVYTPSRLFATDMENIAGIYTTNFPGYEVRRSGGDVTPGTTFGFDIVGPALYFDDATDTFLTTDAMFEPPAPQLAISLGANSRATAGGFVAGFNFLTFNQVGDHSHLSYTLLGDGVTASDGPAGVYALALHLTSSALATSETYYLLVGKDVEPGDPLFLSAIAAARATLVPVSGDMDCSGVLDAADVAAFVQALLDPDAFEAAHPNCGVLHGDMTGDHAVDGRDVQPFVAALLGS